MVGNNIRGQLKAKQASNFLQKIADDILATNPNAIFRNDDTIFAFADYEIIKFSDEYEIWKQDNYVASCGSCRIALAWCIFDKYNQVTDATNLLHLENQLTGKQSEMMHYRHFINSRKITPVQREITLNRLDVAKDQYQLLRKQINKSINVAKYWQQKGFDNETIRPRITAD